MHLHQHGQSSRAGQVLKMLQARVVQDRRNEQDGVRTPFDGFQNLARFDDEILAQQRQLHRSPNLPQKIQRTLEEHLIGEHGKTTGPRRLVFAGDADRIKIGADDAGRGGCLFHLGNQGDVPRARVAQGREEIARLGAGLHPGA
ncbi:MAG: hypothetical protein BWX84_01593 [Verrucomicrobia bacterium ADurb.Bin118]|nr:MAG: hypothetical protein BWX84_01593 [Verrucomicrobia bacterium ADurb.Bin118]